jgi:hypothetical protein
MRVALYSNGRKSMQQKKQELGLRGRNGKFSPIGPMSALLASPLPKPPLAP